MLKIYELDTSNDIVILRTCKSVVPPKPWTPYRYCHLLDLWLLQKMANIDLLLSG
jgi:hypothetical protein